MVTAVHLNTAPTARFNGAVKIPGQPVFGKKAASSTAADCPPAYQAKASYWTILGNSIKLGIAKVLAPIPGLGVVAAGLLTSDTLPPVKDSTTDVINNFRDQQHWKDLGTSLGEMATDPWNWGFVAGGLGLAYLGSLLVKPLERKYEVESGLSYQPR